MRPGRVARSGWVLPSVVASLALVAGGCASTARQPQQAPPGAPSAAPDAGRTDAPPRPPPLRAPTAIVASVTDGDTIRLAGGRSVRLVQIDTPELGGGAECGGVQAAAALRSQLPPGTRVRLVADPATDRVDRYGRLLRYVYRGRRNLNVWMVARGHATPYFFDGEQGRFAVQLMRGARAARSAGIGLWGRCPAAVLDAYRGASTGALGGGGASDAAAGAAQLLPAEPASGRDRDCADLPGPVRVSPGDPHRLDDDGDGIGCE